MEIKDLQARMGKVDMVVEVTDVEEPREFEKFGNTGKVANAKVKDSTGEIKLTLWNEQADMFKPGDKVKITNGYVNEYQGDLQLTSGKFGKIEKVEPEAEAESSE